MNIGTIRRQNLEALISEAGSRRELCRRAETSYSYLTQILTRRKMESGRSREVGHKLARSLERGMNKPQGWMDQIHNNKEQTDNSLTLNVKTLSNALKFIDEYLRDNYYSNTVNLRAKTLALLYELMADKHGASLDHKTIIKIIGEIDKRIE